MLKGKTFTSKGERRYALTLWQLIAGVILFILLLTIYRDGQIMKELAVQQYLVYEVDRRGQVTIHSAEEYQVGPLQVEIEGRAIDAVRWIVKADSTDVETARAEAVRMMTDEMAREFENKKGDNWVDKIKKLNIYRKFDFISARPLKAEDLPAGERGKTKITKYDVVVFGKVNTYRRGSGDWLDENNFAIHVTLQPQESRTKDNMSALKIDLMGDLDPKQVMTETQKIQQQQQQQQTSASPEENKSLEEKSAEQPTEKVPADAKVQQTVNPANKDQN